MKRYFIEEAKCGVTEGGIACGPVGGNVVASVKYNDGEETAWLTLVEVTGFVNVFLTEKEVYTEAIAEPDDEEFYAYMNEHAIHDFNGIEFDEAYGTSYSSMSEDPENPANPLIRYLFVLARCTMEELDGLIELAEGRYADELDIPMADVEEEWIADNEEEEEDE